MTNENSQTTSQTTDSSNPEKKRYYEPAPQDIDVDNFRKVIESRRSVRKFTKKANSCRGPRCLSGFGLAGTKLFKPAAVDILCGAEPIQEKTSG